jgi:hypothetical protein
MKTKALFLLACAWLLRAGAQTVLFDFENAPVHTSLPLDLTVGGITAHFSATGQGMSIQPVTPIGTTPAGFSGNCIYPNSIYASDLLVSFSLPLTDFSILYAPQELACDSSATMRVTAYMGSTWIGTATTNAQPGTWPSETLQIHTNQPFNNVVVHYDKPPITGGDYGPIFVADNMRVAPEPLPIVLSDATMLPDGSFQFAFANNPGTGFTVLVSTNPALPLTTWSALGAPTEISSGLYQFTDLQATNNQSRFYRVSSP